MLATAPPARDRVAQAASSTVTGSGPAGPGRSVVNVCSLPETSVTVSPSRNWTWSTACEAMSPSAPDPADSLRSRHVIGACSSASQS